MSIAPANLAALRGHFQVVAVTGTNGKSTTVSMLRSIGRAAGRSVVLVNTLGMWVDDQQVASDGSMASFATTLEKGKASGADLVALEVTSRALAGGFAERFPPDVAVFTNLSRDHLDRHGSAEAYLAAKARLFMALGAGGAAVLNAADPASALIAEVISPGVTVDHFGGGMDRGPPSALAIRELLPDVRGTLAHLEPSPLAAEIGGSVQLAVPGTTLMENALAAAVAARRAGLAPERIREGLSAYPGLPGRFEVVSRSPLVIVDFAHTPAALERVLADARRLLPPKARLACVFGCGGGRDPTKRPAMGRIADAGADTVWLTTDNPRSENPIEIAHAVEGGRLGQAGWHVEPDRRIAIGSAIRAARPADCVLIAGRGPEALQDFGETRTPLDDREAAVEAITDLSKRGCEG